MKEIFVDNNELQEKRVVAESKEIMFVKSISRESICGLTF